MTDLNFFNRTPRKIIFFEDSYYSFTGEDNPNLYLIKGETYTLEDIENYPWLSLITLEEFPDKWFNSIHFCEIEFSE